MRQPPRWTDEHLAAEIDKAKVLFREERLREPLEAYLRSFDQSSNAMEALLDASGSLNQLDRKAVEIVTSPELLEAFRYLAGPPVSKDDLRILAEAKLSASQLRAHPEMVVRVLSIVQTALDTRRFPWVTERREPSESERSAAILATAALLATSRVGTSRRNKGKERQELAVRDALLAQQWREVAARAVRTISDAPLPSEFCRESLLGSAKADFLVGLRDRRIMAVECKVSNSAVNSVKRLNREAAGKAEKWIHDFGALNVVPVAVLSGVYKLHNVQNAQERGLTIYWAHDLTQLVHCIEDAG